MPSHRQVPTSGQPHRPGAFLRGAVKCFAVFSLAGCNDTPTTPAANASTFDRSVDVAASSLVTASPVSPEYYWAQGSPPTPMGTATQRVCFLVSVGGKFETAGDSVVIYKSGGSWYLGGTLLPQSDGVRAKARCYPGVTEAPGAHYATSAASALVTMQGPPYVCGLTGVSGHLAWGDHVGIYLSSGASPKWMLGATAYSLGPGERYVASRARCFSPITYYSRTAYVWNGFGGASPPPTQLWSTIGESFCYLTQVAGSFENGQLLWVYKTSTHWFLVGSSQQQSMRGEAHCIKRYGWGTSS